MSELETGTSLVAMTKYAQRAEIEHFKRCMDAITPYGPYLPLPLWKRLRNAASWKLTKLRWRAADWLREMADRIST